MIVQLIERPRVDEAIHAISTNYTDKSYTSKKCVRIIGLVAGACISAVAKYYSYPISKEAGISIFGDNSTGHGFGIAFQAFYSKAFFILEMWALGGILTSVIGPATPQESKLGNKRSVCSKVALGALVIAAAVFARYPFSLPAVEYNPSNKWFAGGFSLAASLFIPMRSLMLSFEKAIDFSKCSGSDELKKAKSSCVQAIEALQSELLDSSTHTQAQVEDAIVQLDEVGTSGSEYLNTYTSFSTGRAVNNNTSKKVLSGITTLFLTGVLEYAIASYTYKLTKKLVIDDNFSAVLFSTFAVLTTFHIYGKAMYAANYRGINWLSNRCCCSPKLTIAERVYPVSVGILKGVEFISNIIALGTWYQIWNSFFDDDSKYFFVPVLLFTLFETLQTSSNDKINDVLLSSIFVNCCCSDTQKKAINTHKKLNRIKSAINRSNESEFMTFYSRLNDGIKPRLFSSDQIRKLNEMKILT